MLDAVKVNDSEEISDRGTESNVVHVKCEEKLCVLYFKNAYSWKCLVIYL